MAKLVTAWKHCSKYIRLRDAIYWNAVICEQDIIEVQPELLVVKCCTCPTILTWTRMDAGHFLPKSKGSRGQSGVYFDERNIHAQCGECNFYEEGKTLEYRDFMMERYGPVVIDELRKKDKLIKIYNSVELKAIAVMYREMFKGLLYEHWRM